MVKLKKILTCIDFSEYSLMTLEFAVNLAKDKNSQLIINNVINRRDIEGLETIGTYFSNKIVLEDYVRDLKIERRTMVEDLIKKNFSDTISMMTIKIDAGVPFECILERAEKEDADLIVMGNKGRGNIARVLFGSVAEKVFRHSPIPVVSVRDRSKFKRR